MADALAELVTQLIEARRRQEVTQADVGAAIGVTPMSVSGWESRHDNPSPSNLFLWARALGVAVLVVDAASGRWLAPRPVPQAGETPEAYWLRSTALTLRDARREADRTQAEVAQRLGVSTWAVHQWENGRRSPLLPRLVEWCGVVGCRLELRGR